MVGQTISHYKILDQIGEGGMGVVYKAEDTKLHRTVALKFLRSEAVESEELKIRFLNEAESAAALDHPNICTIYEIDEADGEIFLAMAYVEGESLAQRIKARPLPLDEAIGIATQITEGLLAAHKKNIVHRDIKSANIMIDTEERVKIMDFGLAHLGGHTRITKAGVTLGTPAYMSPEQVHGEATDQRVDTWALGVVVYEMVTGQLPFRGEAPQAVMYSILNEEPEPPTGLRSGLPIDLDRVVGKALAKNAAERYQHIEDLLVDLRSVRQQLEAGGRPRQQKLPPRVEISVGQTLGHYRLEAKLGEGGMGAVYRALDTHLDRPVAIKVLRSQAIASEERKRRFVQEAKAASALNHPNIITIHDINTVSGVDFIVMEFVDGKTLDRVGGGNGMAAGEALKYAVQMADALAQAHGAGIVHRDIKPANIMVTSDERVKVLDFGLAKLTEPAEGDVRATGRAEVADSPGTEEGTILGTVAYMSPEQAEGKRVDVRSDVFSFGSVLYEMITGRRAFLGETKMSVLSAILREEPKPVSQVVASVPREVERVITRCMRKDPRRRFQHMDDLKVALEELKEESDSGALAAAPATGKRLQRQPALRVVGTAAVALVLAAAGWFSFTRSRAPIPEIPLVAVPLTSSPGPEWNPSFSPDGNQVAFARYGQKRDNYDIYIKVIGVGEPRPLTTNPAPDLSPAWSPDGRYIAFLRRRGGGRAELLLIPPIGGAERKLREVNIPVLGGTWDRYLAWSPDAKWLAFPHRDSPNEPVGLFLYSIETEEMRRLTAPSGRGADREPAFSPDGRSLAFTRFVNLLVRTDLYLVSLSEDLVSQGEPALLASDMGWIRGPVWTPDGREIVFSANFFSANQALWRIAASGEGKPRQLGPIGDSGFAPALSPDGRRLAYAKGVAWANMNIIRLDVSDAAGPAGTPEQFIASTQADMDAHYSPGGRRIAFSSYRSGHREIWVCDSDGTNSVRLTSMGMAGSPSWSPDGRSIAYDSNVEGQYDIYVIAADGGAPRRLTDDPSAESSVDANPNWSRDGKWIYFYSNRTGETQVWKVPSGGGAAVQVTRQGGSCAKESVDGKHLFYARDDRLWKAPVDGGDEMQVAGSEDLQDGRFAISADGVYFITAAGPDGKYPIQFFSFATGSTRQIAAIVRGQTPLSVSPDGRWILYRGYADESDLMLVEDFR